MPGTGIRTLKCDRQSFWKWYTILLENYRGVSFVRSGDFERSCECIEKGSIQIGGIGVNLSVT